MRQWNILLYGGCHALVLRDIIAAHFSEEISCTLLINFDLIRSGRPFPYDQLRQFDLVLFSPIENKGPYNTSLLVDACREVGVETVCYPWLEWHGYCPGASKAEFRKRFQWRYADLAEAATSFSSFREYADWAIESYPSDAAIDACLKNTTTMLQASEERNAMPVRISSFILENYQRARLFLISDHPSLLIYLHILAQIFALVGVDGASQCARIAREGGEPQWRWRTPIFPRVAERLGLRFADTTWVDDEMVPGARLDLRSYLLLYYHCQSVVLGPICAQSSVRFPACATETFADVHQDTRLIAGPLEDGARGTCEDYRLLGTLSGAPLPIAIDQPFTIVGDQWRNSWG